MDARARYRAVTLALLTGLIGWVGWGTGCATNRGILDSRPSSVSNPAVGPAVKIVRVTDRREFQLKPRDPSTPSLKGGEIENRDITSRAIARKRNSYGKALGDILLPEGRTVEQLIEEALTRGLRESGLRVLEEGTPDYADAVPLEVDIDQCWAWMSPGFWAVHLEFDSRIRVSGPIEPFADGEELRGYVRLGTQAATGRAWGNTIDKGLDNLSEDLKSRVRGVAAAPR
jgi:hypothetical protein